MDSEPLWRQYTSLPAEAQRQVMDFIAFLAVRYRAAPDARQTHPRDLSDEPIVGMWARRDDLTDSSDWVSAAREREWNRRRG